MRWFGISLGEGNNKVGEVLTFSLPSLKTCPGASSWCLKNCYSHRLEKIRPSCRQAYENNLALTADIGLFTNTMIGALPRIMSSFRLHVGGDFFDRSYIYSWLQICSAFPQVHFWSYTRSWTQANLLPALEEFRRLNNVEIFASTDPTMSLPPTGWRVAFIDIDVRAKGPLCSQQTDTQASCLECGYCFRHDRGNVVFKVH